MYITIPQIVIWHHEVTGSIDVRLDVETTVNILNKTTIYCFNTYDIIIQFTQLSSIVRR